MLESSILLSNYLEISRLFLLSSYYSARKYIFLARKDNKCTH